MKKMTYRYWTLVLALLLCPLWSLAQENKNIVKYGDFQILKANGKFAEGWYTSSNFFDSRQGDFWIRPGSSDDRCIRLQPNSGYVLNSNLGGKENLLMVEPGAEYELTIWVKDRGDDQSGLNRFDVEFDWYTQTDYDNRYEPTVKGEKVGSVTASYDWQAYKLTVKVPNYANSAALRLKFLTYFSTMLIDDITMVKTKDAQGGETPKPTGVKVLAAQHEIEMEWLPTMDSEVSWEYQLDGGEVVNIGSNTSLVLDRLPAGEKRVITLWGIKGGQKSEQVVQEVRTEPFRFGIDDPRRIPYLRTINSAGTCWRYLKLYYNELYNLDAKFTYKQNGRVIEPNAEGVLELDWQPTVSEFLDKAEIEVTIDEGEGRKWTLTYSLTVSKDPVLY